MIISVKIDNTLYSQYQYLFTLSKFIFKLINHNLILETNRIKYKIISLNSIQKKSQSTRRLTFASSLFHTIVYFEYITKGISIKIQLFAAVFKFYSLTLDCCQFFPHPTALLDCR